MSTGRSFEDHPSDDATREPHFRRTRRGTLMGLEAAESSHPWRYAGLCGRMPSSDALWRHNRFDPPSQPKATEYADLHLTARNSVGDQPRDVSIRLANRTLGRLVVGVVEEDQDRPASWTRVARRHAPRYFDVVVDHGERSQRSGEPWHRTTGSPPRAFLKRRYRLGIRRERSLEVHSRRRSVLACRARRDGRAASELRPAGARPA